MIMDVVVGLIIVSTMLYGLRKGFIFTFIHTIGWVLALVLAYIATPYVKRLVVGETTLYDSLKEDFVQRFSDSAPATENAFDSLPGNIAGFLGDKAGEWTDSVIRQLAGSFADLTFTVLIFVALVIAIRFVLWLVLRLLSKDYNDGFMNFFDGLFGLVFGLLKGLLVAFIFLALLLPAVNLVSPEHTEFVVSSLDHSLFAKTLYDNNFIVLLLESFF